MKRLLTFATFLICSLLTTFAQYSGSGNGTEEDPYLIFNENQLSQVSNFLDQEGVVFKLMKDLDLTSWIAENNPSQGWMPIGVESTPFKGKFYGNNHRVSGFSITRSSENNVGFFGYLYGAVIQDFTLEGTQVIGANCVGGLIGQSCCSTISNVAVTLTGSTGVSGTQKVGGLAGKTSASCSIDGFSISTNVSGTTMVGGVIGTVDGGNYQHGTVLANVTATNGRAGGFSGNATGYTLATVSVVGNITSQGSGCRVGGMVAVSDGNVSLSDCTYKGDLQGTQMVGGIIGELVGGSSQTFTSCFSKGKITNTGDYTGGIVAVSNGACIANMESCSHFGDITGNNYTGGLIGAMLSADIRPTLSTYTVRNKQYTSGYLLQTTVETIINGTKVNACINNCTAIGNIEGTQYIGGLIGQDLSSYGYSPDAESITCSSPNDKYLFKDDVYAGISRLRDGNGNYRDLIYTCSYARNSVSHSLTNNYYSGTIRGTSYVGGLVGQKGGGELKNNYSYANIFGDQYVGGIVGATTAQRVENSYNTTTLKSNVAICSTISATTSGLGRIYGTIDTDYTVIGALGSADGNRSLAQTKLILQGVVQEIEDNLQQGNSIGPSLLKLKATYVSMGWNFDDNWNILETECFPYKRYQAAPPIIESNLVSQATSITGRSVDGGTVYLYYKDRDAVSTECDNHQWTFNTEALQSGALVQIYSDVDDMTPSYFTTTNVGYPGSGTENDPWRIYTAEDLQGASNRGYYKLMNDIDLTTWINENSPTKGWVSVGRNSGEATYIDGDGHKVSGLWIDAPTENFIGLFSNFSAGQIKNLTVEVATGKKVKGGDYTGILIGRNANGRIINCSVKGEAEGTIHTGGVVGYVEASTINAVTFDGEVTSSSDNAYIGGIAGQIQNCAVSACRSSLTVSASGDNSRVGGLAGYSTNGTITKSVMNVSLTATGTGSCLGGLIGYSETPITLSVSTGSIVTTGVESYAGGLVGYAMSPISDSYSTANITGTQFTAGLVGYTFSTIDKCYAKGDINGVVYGAGLVGELDGAGASLTNSVACNNILSLSAQQSWGSRVIGGYKNGAADPDESNYALSTMQVSLNNVPQTKTDDIVEGQARTATQLMQVATYQGIGWDFSETWGIDEGEMYPYLLWEIDINPVADVSLDKTSMLIAAGKSETLTASVLPLGATNKRLEWTSSNTAIATVEDGVVTAVAIGTATITATSTDGSNISAICQVTVTANKDAAIAELQSIVDSAQDLYDNSTEGENIGEYATGARAELLAVINNVNASISNTMSDEAITQCTNDINAAIVLFQSKKVTAGEDSDVSQIANTIYLERVEAAAGSTLRLSVKMKNATAIQGYQFDLYLPAGVTIAEDEDGFAMAELSTERTTTNKTNYFDTSVQTDGGLRVLCGSSKGYTFNGNDGEVAVITLNIAENVTEGEHAIILRNIRLSDSNSTLYLTEYLKSTLVVSSYTLGDANNDGSIDVADFIAVANHILGNTVTGFVEKAADVNEDGSIDVADFIGVANMILHQQVGNSRQMRAESRMMRKAATDLSGLTDAIYVEPVTASPGTQQVLSVKMKNATEVAGYEFSLQLPEGITVATDGDDMLMAELSTERTTATRTNYFDASLQTDGTLKVLCGTSRENPSTGKLYTFSGNDGEVARITVNVASNVAAGDYAVLIKDALISDPDAVKTTLQSVIESTLTVEESDGRITFDEASTALPAYTAGEKGNVRMIRTINANEWSTIVLPFTLTKAKAEAAFGDDVQLAEFSGFVVEYTDEDDLTPDAIVINLSDFTMTAKKGMTGGKPFFIKTSRKIESFEADDVTLFNAITDVEKQDEYDTRGKLTGTFVKTKIPADGLFVSDNKFWYSVGNTNVKAFRCWFELGAVLDKETDFSSRVMLRFMDDPASIQVVRNEQHSERYFDLQGRHIKSPTKKGLYVVNGKKVVVK